MLPFKTKIPNHFDLPRRISRLGELAYNMWWTWNPNAQRLFYRIDYDLWESVNHNPLKFLESIGRVEINAAAQNPAYLELYDHVFSSYDAYMRTTGTWYGNRYDLTPGVYGLANEWLDSPWPKMLRARERFATSLSAPQTDTSKLFDLLAGDRRNLHLRFFGVGEVKGAAVQGTANHLLLFEAKNHFLGIAIRGENQLGVVEAEIRKVLSPRK